MEVNIRTEQANGLETKLSVELHQRIYRTQENTMKKTKKVAVQSFQTTKLQEPTSGSLILIH